MRNILVFGRRGQGKTTLGFYLAKSLGLTVVAYDPNDQLNVGNVVGDVESVRSMLETEELITVFRPRVAVDVDDEFHELARLLLAYTDFTLLVDEASLLQTAGYPDSYLNEFVRRSRGINLIQTLHRPSDAAKICRAMATDWYLFQTTDPADLAAISEQCGDEVAEAASRLEAKHYVHCALPARTFEVSGDPALWFVPLNNAPFEVDLSQVLEARSHAIN